MVDVVIMNAYIIFSEILTICSQDIEQKRNYDRRNNGITDGLNDGQPKSNKVPLFQSRAIKIGLSGVTSRGSNKLI